MSTLWIIKYLPKNTQGIVGRENEVLQIRDFLTNYKSQKKKALLLYGPCGSGKTSVVTAFAKELNYEFLEINASDVRNKVQIQEKIGPALKQKSFFHDGKIILVDEIDGLSGMKDRGGAAELARLIDTSAFPIILTANDLNDKLKPVMKKSIEIAFDKLDAKTIQSILTHIYKEENLTIDEKILRTLSIQSDGDVRAAINDLQLVCQTGDLTLVTERKRTQDLTDALRTIYKTTDASLSLLAFEEVNEDMDQRMLWMDYNVPFEYTQNLDLAKAYGAISRADVFRGRIMKNQEWRFLVYINALLTVGVSLAKKAPYKSFVTYKRSSRLLKVWQINMSNAKRKSISQKIASVTHASTRKVFQEFEYWKHIVRSERFTSLVKSFDLDKDEIAWLRR